MPPKGSTISRKRSARQSQAQAAAAAAAGAVSTEQVARRTKRHLDELERSNYTEPKFTIGGEQVDVDGVLEGGGTAKDRMRSTISDKKRKSSVDVRRILLYKKNLATHLDEFASSASSNAGPSYLTAAAPPPTAPRRPFCTVCGYWGKYSCQKCAMHYCSLSCQTTHDETRCEKRVL